MTGDTLVPIAAVFVGVLAVNLALAWFLARRDWKPPEPLRSADSDAETAPPAGPEDAETAPPTDPEFEPRADANDESRGVDGEPRGDPPSLDVDDETVACRHCGAENRPEYRYCRWCVRPGFAVDDAGAAAGSAMTERSL